MEERRILVVLDAHAEEDDELADTLETSRIESVMCVPLISGSRLLGALYFDSLENPHGFEKHDLCHFMDLPRRSALSIEYAKLARELFDIANQLPLRSQLLQD